MNLKKTNGFNFKSNSIFVKSNTFPIGFVGVVIIGIAMLSGGEDETLTKPHAEVVDTYKGCDIVR